MSNFRAAMVLALAGLAAAVPAGCSSSGPTLQTFDQKDQGYALSCSNEWYRFAGSQGNDLQLMPTEQADTVGFRDSVLVHTETLAKPMTLDVFFATKAGATSKARPELGLTVQEQGPVTLGGQEARRMIYATTGSQPPKTSIVWFLVKGDRGYTILATADTSRFDTMRPKFDAVAQAFRLQTP